MPLMSGAAVVVLRHGCLGLLHAVHVRQVDRRVAVGDARQQRALDCVLDVGRRHLAILQGRAVPDPVLDRERDRLVVVRDLRLARSPGPGSARSASSGCQLTSCRNMREVQRVGDLVVGGPGIHVVDVTLVAGSVRSPPFWASSGAAVGAANSLRDPGCPAGARPPPPSSSPHEDNAKTKASSAHAGTTSLSRFNRICPSFPLVVNLVTCHRSSLLRPRVQRILHRVARPG